MKYMEILNFRKFNKKKVIIGTIILGLWLILTLVLKELLTGEKFSSYCILSSTIIFLYEIYQIFKNTGMIFSPIIIFLSSFYLFQTGQLLLLALNIDFDSKYIDSLIYLLPNVSLFTALSNIIAGLAGIMVSLRSNKTNTLINEINEKKPRFIEKCALFAFACIFIIYFPVVLYEFFHFAIHGGRFAIREFEETLPSIFGMTKMLFAPFGILYLVFSESRILKKIVATLVVIGLILESLCGNRTFGTTGLLALMFLPYLSSMNKENRKKAAKKIIILGIGLVLLIVVAGVFRVSGNIDGVVNNSQSIVTQFVSEVGGSCFPLFTAMNIVPRFEGFLFGKQYIMSFFNGIIPSVFDVTGIIGRLTANWYIFQTWMDKYYDFSFSIASSLNTEAYINFGWFGLIAIFFICYFICLNLSPNFVVDGKINKYAVYKAIVLMNLWIIIPRGQSISIWVGILWGVIAIMSYIVCMYLFKSKVIDRWRKNEKKITNI